MPVGNPRTRAGWSSGARVLIAGVIIAAGALTLPGNVDVAAGSYTTRVKEIPATPAVGSLGAIIRVHFVADGYDGDYGPDVLQLTGPSGTPCADVEDTADVNGPRQDLSGPVTLYIGPRASRQYPWAFNGSGLNTYDIATLDTEKPLAQWCPGTYTGNVGYLAPPTDAPGTVDDNFQFRIVANKATKLPTTVARHLRSVTVKPDRGGRGTVFAVHYRADSTPYYSGDAIQVYGPKHSACQGSVVRTAAGHHGQTSRPLTLHIGPGAAYHPYADNSLGKPLQRWCSGTYNGTILYEHGPKFTAIARFKLHVHR